MLDDRRSLVAVLSCGALLLAGVTSGTAAAAQEVDATTGESGFGVEDTQVVTIPFSAFHVARLAGASLFVDFSLGGVLAQNGSCSACTYLIAPVDAGLVPNGALITGLAAFVRDDDADVDEDIQVELCRNWIDNDGTNPGFDCPYSLTTNGSPGDTVRTSSDDLLVRYRYDIDADGTPEFVGYTIRVTWGVGTTPGRYTGADLWLRQVRILYRRQLSPPPEVATFGDVPLDHSQSQFIEALAAAGISEGCGGGNFCPDNPVTRAQLALFLARALGLHWPAL